MRLIKVTGWRQKLNAHIEANRNVPHVYGQHDCGLWAMSALKVTTGKQVAPGYRGSYSDALGAVRRMKAKHGVTTPEALAGAILGPSKPPVYARAGDIVAADLEALGLAAEERQTGLSLGVCNGPVCYFVGEAGLVEVPTLQTKLAFNG